MIHYLSGAVVRVDGMGHYTLSNFVHNTKLAIGILRARIGQPATPGTHWAMGWLRACGAHSKEDVDRLGERLALLAGSPDPVGLIRCARCTRPLSDPLSKLLGLGPECRKHLARRPLARPAYAAAALRAQREA